MFGSWEWVGMEEGQSGSLVHRSNDSNAMAHSIIWGNGSSINRSEEWGSIPGNDLFTGQIIHGYDFFRQSYPSSLCPNYIIITFSLVDTHLLFSMSLRLSLRSPASLVLSLCSLVCMTPILVSIQSCLLFSSISANAQISSGVWVCGRIWNQHQRVPCHSLSCLPYLIYI